MKNRLSFDQQIEIADRCLRELAERDGEPPAATLEALAASLAGLRRAGGELEAGRQAAQTALEAERALAAAVLDTAATLVIVLDREGHILRFNRACEQATGYTADEVTGRRIWDFLLLPEEAAPVRAIFDALRDGHFPNQFENTWVARDGSRRLIAWTNTAIAGPDGAVETVIGTGLDITAGRQAEETLRQQAEERLRKQSPEGDAAAPEPAERLLHELQVHQIELEMQNEELRQAQERLETSRARYFDLYNMAPVGYVILSERGLILEANLAAATLLGVARASLVKQPITHFFFPEDQDIYYLHHKRLAETGVRQVFEVRVARPSGELIWARLEAIAARPGETEASACRIVMSDITAQKEAEGERERLLAQMQAKNEELHAQTLELEEERARLRAIIDSAPEAILVADEGGAVVLANPAAARLFAAPAAAEQGLDYYQRVARYRPDRTPYQPHRWPLFRAAVHRETEHDLPMALLWPDGQWRDVLVSAVPILDSRGHAHGAVAVYQDITERIQAEAERERLLEQTQRDRESLAAMAQILEKEWNTLQTIMESTHAQLAYLDPDFNFVRVNSAYAQGSGHSQAELIGHNHFGLFPNAENQAIFEQVRATGQPVVFHAKPFEFADQPERGVTYWDWTLVPVKEADGQVRGLVLSLLDVTQQVQAEQERERHLARLDRLIRVSQEILAEKTLEGLAQHIADAARALTEAGIGASGHGYQEGTFRVGASSRAEGVPACPPGEVFSMQQGGVYRELIEGAASIRLTQEQLRAHPTWWGLPEGHVPLRGLLGARLVGRDGRANGVIMVSDKAGGGDFSAEDEALLAQLATLASLAAQHIEAQNETERRADELDAVFAGINEAVTVHDIGGQVVRANPAADANYGANLAGADRAAIVQKLSLRYPDGSPLTPEAMAVTRALHGERVRGERFILTTPDGRDLTILVSAAPLAAHGQASAPPAGAVVVWHDVTERERLLEENRRQREFMERLVETAPIGVAVVRGPDHRYEFANPYYRAISGIPGTPVLGRTFAEVFPAVATKDALSMVEAVYETGQTVGAREYEANVGLGREQTYWDVNCVPLKTAGGDVEAVLIVAHEVTEEVLARRQVEELAARDEAILTSLTEGVITVDLEGTILTMNPAALRILGWERVEQARRRPQEYPAVFELRSLDGRVLPVEQWPLGRLLRGETFSGYEVQVRRLDNEAILVGSYGGAPVRDAAGNVILGVLALRDVTAQKQAEEQIKAALAEKEVLMREIYHRVKNNLQALIYLMDMQADYIPDESTRQMIRELQERARSMALVHEKLYQSHNLAQIDFGDYLHDLVDNVSRAFGAGRPIVWRIDAASLPLNVDTAIPCGLIVSELLTNALKYAFPAGEPREPGTECAISVASRADGDRITLIVGDNGVGLPPEVDWSTTRTLGMQLVNILARHQLGGQVEVDRHAGTTFKITFADRKKRE